jgi:hypothetical protein
MTGSYRLELADQRGRIAALEGQVARLVEIVFSDAAVRAMREAERREAEMLTRYGAIQALVEFLEPDCIEATGRTVRRICSAVLPVPVGAERHVTRLRQIYGARGPDTRTVRRALTNLTT